MSYSNSEKSCGVPSTSCVDELKQENHNLQQKICTLETQNKASQREIDRLRTEIALIADRLLEKHGGHDEGAGASSQEGRRCSSVTSKISETLSGSENMHEHFQVLQSKISSMKQELDEKGMFEIWLQTEHNRLVQRARGFENGLREAKHEAEMNLLDSRDAQNMVSYLEKTLKEFRNTSSGVTRRMNELVQVEGTMEKLIERMERVVESLPPREGNSLRSDCSGNDEEGGRKGPSAGGAVHESLFNVDVEAIEWERATSSWSPKRLFRGVRRGFTEWKEKRRFNRRNGTIKMCALAEIEGMKKAVESEVLLRRTVERMRSELEANRRELLDAQRKANIFERKFVEEQHKLNNNDKTGKRVVQ